MNIPPVPCISPPRLLTHHLRELCEGSGLRIETLDAAGIHSETNPREVMMKLGWRAHVKNAAPAIVFPYTDHAGLLNGYCRLKLDTPRIRKKRRQRQADEV